MVHSKKKVFGIGLAAAGFLIAALLVACVAMGGDGCLADDRIADMGVSGIGSGGALAASAVNSSINYQGRLTDSSGNPLSGPYTMTFKLYEVPTGGAALATDTHSVTVKDGLFNTNINLGTSSFDGQALWLGITVQGEKSEMTPRQELRPVPYALSLRPGATINGSVPGSATLKVINTDEGTIYGDGVRATVYSDGSFGVYAEAYGEDCRGVFAHTTRTDSPAVYGYSEKDIGVYGKGKESGGYFTTMAAGTMANVKPGVNVSTKYDYNPGVWIDTHGDDSYGVWGSTFGNHSCGVWGCTYGYNSPGVRASSRGNDSAGVYASTMGDNSPAVYGSSEKDVGVYGQGNEAGGFFSTLVAGTWNNWKPGVNVSTRYNYNPGVRINTEGNDSYGIDVSTDGDGSYGISVATTDRDSRGVYAHTEGDLSYGVYALTEGDHSKGVFALTMDDESDGVYALTEGDESEGVYAYTTGDNSEGVYAWTKGDQSHGVYAHTETNKSYGVYAKTDGGYSHGVYAKTDGYESFGVNAYTSGPRSPAVLGESEHWYGGYFVSDDYFGLYARGVWYAATLSGDLMVWGDIDKDGSCRFVEDHPTDPTKEIVYVCLEGGETGTYTRGSAQLTDGTVVVQLPEHFSLVTSAEGLTVQVTPTSECRGLYVASKSPTEFVVKELNGGTSDATFDFLVNGIRKGYEEFQPIRDKQERPEIGDSGWTPEHLGDEHQLSPEEGEHRD